MGKKAKTEKLKVGQDSPVGLKLAYWYWMELGRSARFHTAKTLLSWSPQIDSLLAKSCLDYERFKWFLVWTCRLRDADGANYGNDFSARYLRAAKNPVTTLVNRFNQLFYDFFLPRADKSIPLLMAKRQGEEELNEAKKNPVPADAADTPLRHIDLLETWTKHYATDENGIVNTSDVDNFRMRLEWLDTLDDRFPMREPYEWEDMEEWIDREFETFNGENWRCEHCTYAFAIDGGDDARIKMCADCAEERRMYEDEDREWMCGEVPSVSCLTKEWD
jgi:hypothetical protein